MCDNCERAVNEQAFDHLEEVAADPTTNCWVTRCPLCKQLWETYAYQPHFSWMLTVEDAKAKYPESSF